MIWKPWPAASQQQIWIKTTAVSRNDKGVNLATLSVDWKFSFEPITFPVIAYGWIIIMIPYSPFQPVKQWTDIRVHSNGWINLLLPFESGQTDKRFLNVWAIHGRKTWTAIEQMKILWWTDVRLNDWRFFCKRMAQLLERLKIRHVLKHETTKQNDRIELVLSKHCMSIVISTENIWTKLIGGRKYC